MSVYQNSFNHAKFVSHRTVAVFVNRLLDRSVAVSMDGRGRALDNEFIERLWRSVKYQEIYLRDYMTVADVEGRIESILREVNPMSVRTSRRTT